MDKFERNGLPVPPLDIMAKVLGMEYGLLALYLKEFSIEHRYRKGKANGQNSILECSV